MPLEPFSSLWHRIQPTNAEIWKISPGHCFYASLIIISTLCSVYDFSFMTFNHVNSDRLVYVCCSVIYYTILQSTILCHAVWGPFAHAYIIRVARSHAVPPLVGGAVMRCSFAINPDPPTVHSPSPSRPEEASGCSCFIYLWLWLLRAR